MRSFVLLGRLALTAALLGTTLPAAAETFVFPHLLEASGNAALDRSPGSSDTIIRATFAALPGSQADGNSVQIYVHEADGRLLTNAVGTPVCGPCDLDVGGSSSTKFSLVEVMVAAGISTAPSSGGYIVIETAGPDAAQIDVTIENELYLPGGNTAPTLMPMRVPCGGGGSGGLPTGKRIRVIPDIGEAMGSPQELAFTDDTTFSIAYTGDHPASEPTPAATVDLYLFDAATAAPLAYESSETVCAPCTFTMGGSRAPRQVSVSLEELLYGSAQGSFPLPRADVMAVLETTGDVDAVTARCVTARSGSTTGDLSLSFFEPREFEAPEEATAVEIARRFAGVQSQPNPFNPKTTLHFTLERDQDVVLRIVDVRGRVVRTLDPGRLPAGAHAIEWDGRDDGGRDLSSGVYLARLQAGSSTSVEKMTLVK